MRLPAFILLFCAAVAAAHWFTGNLQPLAWSGHSTPHHQLSPVLQMLEQVRADDGALGSHIDAATANASGGGAPQHRRACARPAGAPPLDLRPVLAEVGAFAAMTRGDASIERLSTQQLRQLLFAFRRRLGARFVSSLQPAIARLRAAGNNSSSSGCGTIRTIHLPPRMRHGRPAGAASAQQASAGRSSNSSRASCGGSSTTLLLVLDRWERLEPQLQELALSLFMLWGYASVHGYDLHIYVHGRPLPPWMPVYFIKPPGILHMLADWRYEHVLYTDWDVLLSPHTAPPLSLFFGEFPAASLLQQGEYNLCAGVNLWRRSADAEALLRAWWAMGAAGCCPSAQHDQSALKHLVAASLANASGDASLYGPRQQRHFVLPPAPLTQHNWTRAVFTTESPPQRVTSYLRARPRLQTARSAVGLVALEANAPPARPLLQAHDAATAPRVALTSCLGIWWGCVPADTPALLYHVGHGAAQKLEFAFLPPRFLGAMQDWAAVLGLGLQRAALCKA